MMYDDVPSSNGSKRVANGCEGDLDTVLRVDRSASIHF
jgi:hypothetical protein